MIQGFIFSPSSVLRFQSSDLRRHPNILATSDAIC